MLQLHEKPRECPDLWGQIVIGKGIINLTRHGKIKDFTVVDNDDCDDDNDNNDDCYT